MKDKLVPFSGPHHEDRGKKLLYEYNPDMRFKDGRDTKSNPIPLAKSCPKNNDSNPHVDPCDTVEDNTESLESVFCKSSFRVCEQCHKTRILDFRASDKYPLGSYRYGQKLERVRLTCSRLVDIDCDTGEDIVGSSAFFDSCCLYS